MALNIKNINNFMQKVELIPEHTCWEWIAASDGNGYGYFKFNGKMTGAHRVSHILFKGPRFREKNHSFRVGSEY